MLKHLVQSLQEVMKHYKLREQAGADPQTYALGLKEVWEVSILPGHSKEAGKFFYALPASPELS